MLSPYLSSTQSMMNNLNIDITPKSAPIVSDAPTGFSCSIGMNSGKNIRFATNAIGHPVILLNVALPIMYLIVFISYVSSIYFYSMDKLLLFF